MFAGKMIKYINMDFFVLLANIFVFALGLVIGSFLNCFVYRLEKKEKITGRSFCPGCKNKLSWRDLVPVFSFFALKRKCRHCKVKISWQYPLVELATAIVFLLIFSAQGGLIFNWQLFNLVFLLYIASSLIAIFVYDLKHYLIPDKILLPAIVITFFYRLLEAESFYGLLDYLLAILPGAGFFLLIFLISKGQWIGFGDVKLAILMGLILGVQKTLLALFLSFFSGAIIGLILIVAKNRGLKSEIPFGPFLIMGTFAAILWGSGMIEWYLQLYKF